MCSRPEDALRWPRPLRLGRCLVLCMLWSLALGVASGVAQEDAVASARATAQARVAAAESARADSEILRLNADYSAAETRDSNLASTWQRAEQLLETARNAMADAEAAPSANAFRDAGILANGSRRAFEDFGGRSRRALRSIEAERAPPPPPPAAEPEPSVNTDEPVEETPSEPAQEPPAQEQSSQEQSSQESQQTPDPSSPDGVNDRTSETAPAPPPPPPSATPRPDTRRPRAKPQLPALTSMAPPLRRAVEAYFQGDDAAVLQALATPNDLGSGVHKAHALMVRAAARYQLFLLGGERDHAQRSAAVDDVMACRRLVAELAPSKDLFSPRFVDFFSGIQLPKQP